MKTRHLIIVATLLGTGSLSHGLVAFDNLGPSNLSGPYGYAINASAYAAYGMHQTVGCQFTASVSGTLDKVTLALGAIAPPDRFIINLLSNDAKTGQDRMGDVIHSYIVNDPSPWDSNFTPCSFVNTDSTVFLEAGTKYWIYITPDESDPSGMWTVGTWLWNKTNDIGWVCTPETQAPDPTYHWELRSAFRVEVTQSVPEPISLVGVAVSFVGLAVRRRRLKR